MGTTRTKADAKNELILLVKNDNELEPAVGERLAAALERTLIGRRGKTWLELVVETDADRKVLEAESTGSGSIAWAASLVLGMPLGDHAEIRISNAA